MLIKKTLVIALLLLGTVNANAQRTFCAGSTQIYAFGVHDHLLFVGWGIILPTDPLVWRFFLNDYYQQHEQSYWVEAGTGLDKTRGNITSFASLGPYFFAGSFPNDISTVYRTTDSGAHWKEVIGGPVGTNGTYLFGSYGIGIARSRDSGFHWEHLSAPQGNLYGSIHGAYVFSATSTDLYRSTDSGGTWAIVPTPIRGIKSFAVVGNTIYGTNDTLIRSEDNGATWSIVPSPFAVRALDTSQHLLLAATNNGLHYLDTMSMWHDAGYKDTDCILLCVFDSLLFVETSHKYFTYFSPLTAILPQPARAVEPVARATESISLYPNPATGVVTIASSAAIEELEVENILGTTVLSRALPHSPTATLDLSALPAGSYTVKITTEDGVRVRRVIKD